MVQDPFDPLGYAQIGLMHKNYGSVNERFFWQWGRGAGYTHYTSVFGSPQHGIAYTFIVERVYDALYCQGSGGYCLTMDSPDISKIPCASNPPYGCPRTNFDPVAAWGDPAAFWSGETLHLASDIQGSATYQQDFTVVRYKDGQGVWRGRNVIDDMELVKDACYYRNNVLPGSNNQSFEIHTHPANHVC
ncbi:hypothetical protein BH20ACT24_BH20ACT24_07140 [soil metagenome]